MDIIKRGTIFYWKYSTNTNSLRPLVYIPSNYKLELNSSESYDIIER